VSKSGKMSEILLKEKTSQAMGLVKTNPYESLTIATGLHKKYPDDERAVALCLQVALKAKSLSDKNVMTEEVYLLGKAFSDKIWMSPILSSLHVVSKGLMNKTIEKDDIVSLKMAIKMGPVTTSEILDDARKALGRDHELFSHLSQQG
jgi:hypothetical protein